jgi:hypothetical protein
VGVSSMGESDCEKRTRGFRTAFLYRDAGVAELYSVAKPHATPNQRLECSPSPHSCLPLYFAWRSTTAIIYRNTKYSFIMQRRSQDPSETDLCFRGLVTRRSALHSAVQSGQTALACTEQTEASSGSILRVQPNQSVNRPRSDRGLDESSSLASLHSTRSAVLDSV